jgi:hypothetical protein
MKVLYWPLAPSSNVSQLKVVHKDLAAVLDSWDITT